MDPFEVLNPMNSSLKPNSVRFVRSTARILVLLAFAASLVMAQIGTAHISGIVTDPTGSVVSGVTVTITHLATNTNYPTVTNNAGFYTSPGLPVGAYQVVVESPGFKRTVRSGITLELEDSPQINFALEVGALAESVEVTSSAQLVDASSATVGKVVDNTRIVELPLNGRNGLSLLELTPNVRSQGVSHSGFSDRGTGLSAFSVNGGPSGSNMQIVDGTSNILPRQGDANVNLTSDAIQEFKVQSGAMSAEYSYTLGGVVNMITKSGTNSLHGTAYEFLRNNALDARNFFASVKAPYRYNQFGGAIGGPIKKNKLFYFGNYEDYRLANSYHALGTVPTAAWRTGDLSTFKTATGALTPIYDPASTMNNPSGSGFVRTVFPGNMIPATRLDKVAQNILPFYPLPNTPPNNVFTQTNNYQANVSTAKAAREEVIKVDYAISTKDTFSSRYILWDAKDDNGSQGNGYFPDKLSRVRNDDFSNRNANIAETHIFSPSLINQFHIGVARNFQKIGQPSLGAGYPAKLGLPSSVPNTTLPSVSLASADGISGWPTGFASFTGSQGMFDRQLTDSISLIHGKHAIKLGLDIGTNQYGNNKCQYCSGQFVFNQIVTGNPLVPAGTGSGYASFLLGAVASATLQDNSGVSLVNFMEGYYVQDDVKLTRRLSLNLGLRWDYQQVPGERHNGLSNFDPFGIDPTTKLRGILAYAGPPPQGFGRTVMTPDYKNWSPRFGFAWDLFGTSKTVLRGGYGIYYAYIMAFADDFGGLGYKLNLSSWAPPGGNTQLPSFNLQNGFPTPVVQPLGNALGPGAFLGSSVTYDQPNGRTPYSQQATLNVQQQLPRGFLLEMGYSGNKGTHLRGGSYDLNQLNPQYLSLGNALLNNVKNPYAGLVSGSFGGPTISQQQALKEYPYYSAITTQFPHMGSSIYHSFLLNVEKRMSGGFVMLSSYTFGKSISSGAQVPTAVGVTAVNSNTYQNGKYNRAPERTIDSDDTPQRLVTSIVYELPFGPNKRWHTDKKVANALVSGWQLSGVQEFEGGFPVIVSGANNNLATRPNSTGKSPALSNPTVAQWFDTTQFANPAAWTFGNLARSLPDVRSPGVFSIDISASKTTNIGEHLKVQLRGEAFDALNHPNFLQPNGTFVPGTNGLNSSSTFGVVTAARDPRTIQVAMKLLF
jgi:hypothetical protein